MWWSGWRRGWGRGADYVSHSKGTGLRSPLRGPDYAPHSKGTGLTLPWQGLDSVQRDRGLGTFPTQCGERGAKGQNRTADTTIFSRVLYRLSYLGTVWTAYRGMGVWAGTALVGRVMGDDALGGGL